MDRKADVARRQFAHVLSAKLPNLGNNLPKNTFLPWTHVTNNHTLLEPVVMDVAAIGGNNDDGYLDGVDNDRSGDDAEHDEEDGVDDEDVVGGQGDHEWSRGVK